MTDPLESLVVDDETARALKEYRTQTRWAREDRDRAVDFVRGFVGMKSVQREDHAFDDCLIGRSPNAERGCFVCQAQLFVDSIPRT